MHVRLRFLMAPEDSSPGSGAGGLPLATGGAQGAALQTQAQGQAAGGITREEIAQMLQQHHDRTFADLRRAGVLGGRLEQQPAAGDPPANGKSKGKGDTPAATSPDDVQRMLNRQRTFDRAIGGYQLSEGALGRMERAFAAEAPEDVAGWVKAYVADFGIAGAGGSSPSTPNPDSQTQTTERRPPVTGGPGPAGQNPGDVRDPYSMTEDDANALIRQHGLHKASEIMMDALRRAPRRRLLVRRR